MSRLACAIAAVLVLAAPVPDSRGQNQSAPSTLSLPQCLELALRQNPAVLKAKLELQRTRGLIVEARAAGLPHLTAAGQYQRIDRHNLDVFPIPGFGTAENQEQPWSATIEVSQLLYAGGRVGTAVRTARLTDRVALLDFERVVAETILELRQEFYRVLLNKELVAVREQSVKLLEQQLEDVRHRFDAGTVPQFNVLRAEVELANARPPLIRARNNLRLSREALVKLLAIDAPAHQEFTAITFTGELRDEVSAWNLDQALTRALLQRPELQQAQQQVAINTENINAARAGYKPELSVFGNYGAHDTMFGDDIGDTVHGWTVGARATWPLFDGLLTRGKVTQARAQLSQAELNRADTRRRVELEVRQAYSDFLQARELLEAQKKTIEQAEESLRLAVARFGAGTGTQLDVLSAQTALTEARSNQVQALFDYNVAIANLDRVTGATVRVAE